MVFGGLSPLAVRAGSIGSVHISDPPIDKPNAQRPEKPLRLDLEAPAPNASSPISSPAGSDLASEVPADSDLGLMTGSPWVDPDPYVQTHAMLNPAILQYVEFSSAAKVAADMVRSMWFQTPRNPRYCGQTTGLQPAYLASNNAFGTGEFFCGDPEWYVDRGFPMMSGSGLNRIINFCLMAGPKGAGIGVKLSDGKKALLPAYRHLFLRYVIVIEPDVCEPDYTELGTKLSGFMCGDDATGWGCSPPADGTTFTAIATHSPPRSINGNPPYSFLEAVYDQGGPYQSDFVGPVLPVGVPVTIEQEVNMDGFADDPAHNMRLYVDDVLVHSHKIDATGSPMAAEIQIYMGGTTPALRPLHYRIGGLCIATQKIGRPIELRSGTPLVVPNRYATSFPTAVRTSTPAWRSGLPVGKFVSIPGTSLSALAGYSGGAANPNAWCGFVATPNEWYSALNGGHTDSSDNGVYAIDFTAEAPAWRVVRDPSALAERGAAGTSLPYNADGVPNSRHTYQVLAYCAQRNRLLIPGGYALWQTSGGTKHMDGFDLERGEWDPAGTYPDNPVIMGVPPCPSVATDPRTGDIYVGEWNADTWLKWNCATNTWSEVNTSCTKGYWGACIDVKRNRLVMGADTAHSASIAKLPYFDLTTLIAGTLDTGLTGQVARGSSCAITYDPDNDLYYWFDSSMAMYIVDPDTGVATPIAPDVPEAINGVWNRFVYFGAPIYGIAYYPHFYENVWFMATA